MIVDTILANVYGVRERYHSISFNLPDQRMGFDAMISSGRVLQGEEQS